MAVAVTLALLLVYALLWIRADDAVARRVVVFAAAAQAAIGVAQVTALDERAFTLVLVPAVAIAALFLLARRFRAARGPSR